MTRIEFLTELDRRLEVLPREEADRHLAYYAEILADRTEDGMTDEEAVASLESLDTIASRILGQYYTQTKEKKNRRRTAAICAAIIIGMVSLVVLLIAAVANTSHIVYESMPVVMDSIPIVGETTSDDYTSVTIPSDEIRNIEVNWISDSLTFSVWDEDNILLEVFDNKPLDYEVDGDTLSIGREAAIFSATNASSTLIVTLPRTLAERLLNTLTISTTSAFVNLMEINAARLDLTTISGSCTVDGFFDEARISTTSGDVFFSGGFERGTFEAVSGTLDITTDSMMRSFRADAVSGSVFLTLPADLGFTLEFDSVSGGLYSDLPITYGDGTAEIKVDTISGDLSLATY